MALNTGTGAVFFRNVQSAAGKTLRQRAYLAFNTKKAEWSLALFDGNKNGLAVFRTGANPDELLEGYE